MAELDLTQLVLDLYAFQRLHCADLVQSKLSVSELTAERACKISFDSSPRSLQQKELARSASTAERSLQQKELASLHQLELPHLGAAVKRFQLPRAQLYSTEKTALERFSACNCAALQDNQ